MPKLWYKSVPYIKEDVTLALESGVDGLIVPAKEVSSVQSLARCEVVAEKDMPSVLLKCKEDEENLVKQLNSGQNIVLQSGFEIIPVENLLAQCSNVTVEAKDIEEARLAAGILEKGVHSIVVLSSAIKQLKMIINELKTVQHAIKLEEAIITKVQNVGLGHRVCVDTLSVLQKGQGMLVGNSSAFCFLVHAETEHNEFVAARPFRINAGAVHAYAQLPLDKTSYLEELGAGDEVLIVQSDGTSKLATIGRVKVEVRPMLLIEAKVGEQYGAIFLQNAETIRLTAKDGTPISVVQLKAGDKVLCHLDVAGRHFGMRIAEDIKEA